MTWETGAGVALFKRQLADRQQISFHLEAQRVVCKLCQAAEIRANVTCENKAIEELLSFRSS